MEETIEQIKEFPMEEKRFLAVKSYAKGLGVPNLDVYNTKAQIINAINAFKAVRDGSVEVEPSPEVETEKKESEPTVAEPVADDPRLDEKKYQKKSDIMAAKLASQPKVRVLVPLEGTEKQGQVKIENDVRGLPRYSYLSGAVKSVQLNGYKIIIPKGVYVEVPQQVADLISKNQIQTVMAGDNFKIDRTPEVQKALS